MRRDDIRQLKRAVAKEGSQAAILVLLERSVRFGHKRLALIRCIQAERLGISLPQEVLKYCQHVADSLPVDVLQQVVRQAGAVGGAMH